MFSTKIFLLISMTLTAAIIAADAQTPPSCASKLVPCAPYLNSSSPPADCCNPLRDAITNDLDCLCKLYENPTLLPSLGINITQALALPKACNINGDISACGKGGAPGPSSQNLPPPGQNAMDASKLNKLKDFVEQCQSDPSILSHPSLSFFRSYIESLGGKLPSSAGEDKAKSHVVDESDEEMDDLEDEDHKKGAVEEEEEPEIIESDIELDESDIVDPDNDEPQQMGDSSAEVTEESRDASQEAKSQAMEAISEGKLEEASELLTKAILLNPTSAIMYATRATVYIKMKKPNAAIRDANAALEINPDSAKGYKSRGIARAMLGLWGDAAKDLHMASKLDFDEEISAVLKKVEPNARKIEEHHKKYDRLRKEREDRKAEHERQRRKAEAQAAYEKAKKEEESSSRRAGGMPGGFPGGMPGGFPGGMPGGFPGGMPGGFPGGMPGGFGGMPGGFGGGMPGSSPGGMPGGGSPGGMPGGMPGNIDFSKILSDPELMAAFQDPEVMAALQDVMKNPANLAKHQANPKVAPIIAKMMSKFGGPK